MASDENELSARMERAIAEAKAARQDMMRAWEVSQSKVGKIRRAIALSRQLRDEARIGLQSSHDSLRRVHRLLNDVTGPEGPTGSVSSSSKSLPR